MIRFATLFALFSIVSLACWGCGDKVTRRPVLLADQNAVYVFDTLDFSQQSGHPAAIDTGVLVLSTDAGFQLFWQQHMTGRVPAVTAPPVDFTRERVIVAFMGEQATSGPTIQIHALEEVWTGALVVRMTEWTAPGSLNEPSRPVHIVRSPAPDLPRVIVDTTTVP